MKKSYLETEYQKYEDAVSAYAVQVFEEKVKPYLIKNNLHFLAGNGTYYVFDPKKHLYEDKTQDNLPQYILKALQTEVPGMDTDLGTLMPDYTGDN